MLLELNIRAGEKIHEVLISNDEARHTLELEGMYIIQPLHHWWKIENWENALSLPEDFKYTSDNNRSILSTKQLKKLAEII